MKKQVSILDIIYLSLLVVFATPSTVHSYTIASDYFDVGTEHGEYKATHHMTSNENKSVTGGNIVGMGAVDWSGNSSLFKPYNDSLQLSINSSSLYNRYLQRRWDGTALGDGKYYISGKLNPHTLIEHEEISGLMGIASDANGNPSNISSPITFRGKGLLFGFKGNSTTSATDLILYGNNETLTIYSGVNANTDYTVVVEVDFKSSDDDDVKVWVDDASGSGLVHKITYSGNYFSDSNALKFATFYSATGDNTITRTFDDFLLTTDIIPEPSNMTLLTCLLFSFLLLHRRSFSNTKSRGM